MNLITSDDLVHKLFASCSSWGTWVRLRTGVCCLSFAVSRPDTGSLTQNMDALWRSVQPLDYHNQFLAKGVRPDGRRLLKARRFEACTTAITSVDGSARVRIGNTVVLAAIQCEPTPPADTEPSRGRIIVSLELPGVCSPAAAAASRGGAGRLEREQAALVELLQRTATGGLVDLDDLCAVEGRAVWTCYCDMYVLEVRLARHGAARVCMPTQSSALSPHATALSPHAAVR